MEVNGYDANYVDEPSDYFKCIVCHCVLRNPVLFVDCGHRVCKLCFDEIKEHAAQSGTQVFCPHDRMEVDINKVVEDKGISRAILDFKVRCNNSSDGCGWTGELRNLQNHLDANCSYEEKHNMLKLLKELMKRVETCENKLEEKDKEIANLKQDVLHSQNQIKILEQMSHTLNCVQENKFDIKDKEIANLKQDVFSLNQIKTCEQTFHKVNGDQKNELVEKDKERLKRDISYLQSEIKTLQEQDHGLLHFMNVDEYIPHQCTVFTWKLDDYFRHQENGNDVFSPKFYSRLNGHCCMLSVRWYGDKKGRLGVYLHVCLGIYNEVVTDPFNMVTTLESCDKYGQTVTERISEDDLFDFYPEFIVWYDEDKSEGYGSSHFLNMPSLNNFIIEDVLTIKCTLLHNQ